MAENLNDITADMDDGDSRDIFEPFSISYKTTAADILQGVKAIDSNNFSRNRKIMQVIAIGYVMYLFLPEIRKDPAFIGSWLMIALCILVLAAIFLLPRHMDQKYARRREEQYPQMNVRFEEGQMVVTDREETITISYHGDVTVIDYDTVFCVKYDKRRILSIPKNQFTDEMVDEIAYRLREGFGTNFEIREKKKGLF